MDQEIKKYNPDDNNLEIIDRQEDSELATIDTAGLRVRKGGNIVIGKVNLFIRPSISEDKKYYKENKHHFILDLSILFISLVACGVFVWLALWHPDKNISLNIAAEDAHLTSGKQVTITAEYGNNNGHQIKNANLVLALPKNFVIEEVSPSTLFDKQKHLVSLGSLPVGSNGRVTITGSIIANVNEQENFSVFFNFEKGGRSFSVAKTAIMPIKDSVLKTSLILPQEVYSGSAIPAKLIINNLGNIDFNEVALKFNNGWVLRNNDDKKSNSELTIGSIKKLHSTTTTIYLTNEGDVTSSALSYQVYAKILNTRYLQQETSTEVTTKNPQLSFVVETEKNYLNPDNASRIILKFNNLETFAIRNISLNLHSTRNILITDVDIDNKNILKNKDNTLTIDKLLPGSGEYAVTLKTARNKSELNDTTNIILDYQYQIAGQTVSGQASSPDLKITSKAVVKSIALYYSHQGDQLGIGPLPPTTGIPTTYWIFWEIENYSNELSGLTLSSKLAPGISLTGKKTVLAGDLTQVNDEVSWKVDQIDKEGGNYKIGFEISTTPTEKQLGKTFSLISQTRFKYFDNFTNSEMLGILPSLDSNLIHDFIGKNQGKVVK